MHIIIGLFALVGIVVLALALVLAVQFARLGRELRRVGDDSQTMFMRLGRGMRSLQLAIPFAIAARKKIITVYKKYKKSGSRAKRESR